eukprot:GDKK01050846.1.p2 GENE.GDKK01050846.1~~GDKK01050846.1.p2  ORF type:complete len:163 (+),score=5.40 GDKK01050846.1:123-611(+)
MLADAVLTAVLPTAAGASTGGLLSLFQPQSDRASFSAGGGSAQTTNGGPAPPGSLGITASASEVFANPAAAVLAAVLINTPTAATSSGLTILPAPFLPPLVGSAGTWYGGGPSAFGASVNQKRISVSKGGKQAMAQRKKSVVPGGPSADRASMARASSSARQ